MKNILIAGGSGLIGSRMTEILLKKNYSVAHLSRSPGGKKAGVQTFQWQPDRGQIDQKAIEWADAVINLAGAGIADKRWSPARKKELIESRVLSTQVLKKAIESANPEASGRPKTYLGASAIGFYGNRADEILDEKSTTSPGFLPECTVLWEKAHDEIASLGIRTALLRIGIVFSTKGGALPELMLPIKFGTATYFADGRAWYSWIHIDDLCGQFLCLLENEKWSGVFNGVAPNPLVIKDLSKKIARGMGRGWAVPMPVPAFVLRIIFGEMADCVLNSDRVSSEKIERAGFHFQFTDPEIAVRDLLDRQI